MKAIETKYIGPRDFKGSRFVATDNDGNRVIVAYDYSLNSEDNHKRACLALCRKMGWSGDLVSGDTKTGMVHVWTGKSNSEVWNLKLFELDKGLVAKHAA